MKRYLELSQQLDAIKAEMSEIAKKSFEDGAKELFNNFSQLESFAWTQYTPHFNDGDPCSFGTDIDYCNINGIDDCNGSNGNCIKCKKDIYRWNYSKTPKEEVKICTDCGGEAEYPMGPLADAVHSFLRAFTYDDLEKMYGDGYKITVTREGISVNEYNHD